MGFDGFMRRYQIAILGGFVLLAAYFQASGIAALVSGHLVPDGVTKMAAPPARADASLPETKSGSAILSRNPFDSVTGPLDGSVKIVDDDEGDDDEPFENAADPYKDPPCSGVRASLITATSDPAWSFAAISSNGQETLRRAGDKVGNLTVQHIGFYETDDPFVMPQVWLVDGRVRCVAEMGPPEPVSARPKATSPTTPPRQSTRQKLENEVKSKIKKVGDNQFEVDKSGVELIIQHYAKLASSVRGKSTTGGMALKGIRDGSILGELGMKDGDILKSINGFDMSDPDKAVDAYAKLRRAGKLDIAFSREGKGQNIGVSITK